MKLKCLVPRGKNIIVRRDEFKFRSKAGIVVPETSKSLPMSGTVVAMGKDVDPISDECQIGDKVFFTNLWGIRSSFHDPNNPFADKDTGMVELLIGEVDGLTANVVELEAKEALATAPLIYEDSTAKGVSS
jgi:co-chaperonin GroES (HSP10)